MVEWPGDQRADLETALGDHVVVVASSCDGLRVLPACQVNGAYRYTSVTEKEEQLQLEGVDELRINLPLSGNKLGDRAAAAEHERGARTDLALSIVGKKTASRELVLASDLRGECQGATHFVRGVTLGAFSLSSGSDHRQEGSPDACRAASSTSDAPVSQCSAPLRLELRPVRTSASGARVDEPAAEEEEAVSCPASFVASDSGTCISASSSRPHVCAVGDVGGCTAQCAKGSLVSCAYLGRMYEEGRGVSRDLNQAIPLLGKACTGGVTPACGRLGELVIQVGGQREKGIALLRTSCEQGFEKACTSLATTVLAQPGASSVDVIGVLRRSCRGGHGVSCVTLAAIFHDGVGVRIDDAAARGFAETGCQADAPQGCLLLAQLYQQGRGVPRDPARAASILRGACERGASESCNGLSMAYFTGQGVPRDTTQGIAYLSRACEGRDRTSCLPLGLRYKTGTDVPKDAALAERYLTRACETGLDIACKEARGVTASSSPPPPRTP